MNKDNKTKYGDMSLRDYFAGQVLAGELGHPETLVTDNKEFAEYCYKIADAMIEARNDNL